MTTCKIRSTLPGSILTAVLFSALLMVGAWAAAATDAVSYEGNFPLSTPSGFTHATLGINGKSRDVLIYRPASTASLPLLIFFSGTGATLDYNIADEIGRDALRAFADQQGVIIAIPIPRVLSRGDWDNHSADTPYWETALTDATSSAVSANPDTNPDLLFTSVIIKEAVTRYGADPSRVYLNGFSNGAFFSYFAAATLNDRVAAFAETGGGLVLSNTTAGKPAECLTSPYAGSKNEVRSCAAAGWSPGMCASPDATPRPIAPALASRIPPAWMEANDNDDSVPFAHTCNLADALPASTPRQTRITHTGNGHALNEGYLLNSWNFMKEYRLPLQPNYQGLWWNPNESGWGMSLTQHDATIFAALYTYDQAGQPAWYVISDCSLVQNGCTGDIYRVTGGTIPVVPWNGSAKAVVKAGEGTLRFSDVNNGSFNYTINGTAGSKIITQQIFANGTAKPVIDYTDLWWNPNESGWGMALTQQYNTIFVAWYVYDSAGLPVWYVASGCAVSGNGCDGDLYQVTGGSMLTSVWDSTHIVITKVGNISLAFTDSNNGSMRYTINGAAGSRSIVRQIF